MSAPSPVTIPVSLLSGEQLEVRLHPTDTAAELLAKVEQQLGESPLHDVHLCAGRERLGAAMPAAKLAALLAGGGLVQALRSPSAPKAMRYLLQVLRAMRRECKTLATPSRSRRPGRVPPREFVDAAERCSRALETLLELNVDVNDRNLQLLGHGEDRWRNIWRINNAIEDASEFAHGSGADAADALSCARFAGLGFLLMETCVREGRRQLHCTKFWRWLFREPLIESHELLNEVVIAAVRDPEWHHVIEDEWHAARGDVGGLREAMEWLATEHPQEAVRAAAAEASAALAGPRAPEAPPPAREAAAGAAAGAPAASDEQEEEKEDAQVAEAIEESRAGAVHEEQRLLHEALLRSKECSAAVAVGVVLLRYNHDQKWLVDALFAAGCETHRSGAKMLVPPGVKTAVEDYEGWDQELKTSHVIVAPEWEGTIHSAVGAAKEALSRSARRSTKVTDREAITIPEVASDLSVEPPEDTVGHKVVRTFVHVSVPNSMRSASSFQNVSV